MIQMPIHQPLAMGDRCALGTVQVGQEGRLHRQGNTPGGVPVWSGDMTTTGPGRRQVWMLDHIGLDGMFAILALQSGHTGGPLLAMHGCVYSCTITSN